MLNKFKVPPPPTTTKIKNALGFYFGSSFEKLLLVSVEGKVTIVGFTFITLRLAERN